MISLQSECSWLSRFPRSARDISLSSLNLLKLIHFVVEEINDRSSTFSLKVILPYFRQYKLYINTEIEYLENNVYLNKTCIHGLSVFMLRPRSKSLQQGVNATRITLWAAEPLQHPIL